MIIVLEYMYCGKQRCAEGLTIIFANWMKFLDIRWESLSIFPGEQYMVQNYPKQ